MQIRNNTEKNNKYMVGFDLGGSGRPDQLLQHTAARGRDGARGGRDKTLQYSYGAL